MQCASLAHLIPLSSVLMGRLKRPDAEDGTSWLQLMSPLRRCPRREASEKDRFDTRRGGLKAVADAEWFQFEAAKLASRLTEKLEPRVAQRLERARGALPSWSSWVWQLQPQLFSSAFCARASYNRDVLSILSQLCKIRGPGLGLLLVGLLTLSGPLQVERKPSVPVELTASGDARQGELWQLPIVPELKPPSLVPEPVLTEVAAVPSALVAGAAKVGGAALGSLSIGRANRGSLFNAIRLEDGPFWEVTEPRNAWGTQESVGALVRAINEVNRLYPDSPKLFIGHLSRKFGGWLRPHKSHQSGRDVDLGLYYLGGEAWYRHATPENLDVERTWALVSSLLKTTAVEYVFLSRTLHSALRTQAERIGETQDLIRDVFEGEAPQTRPILRHAWGHQTHLHVRFMSAAAVKNAQMARRALGRLGARRSAVARVLRARRKKYERLTESG